MCASISIAGADGSRFRGAAAEIATADTQLRVVPSDSRLAVVSLRSGPAGFEWARDGGAALPLISSAQVAGRSRAVRWRYVGSRSVGGKTQILTFRYASSSPRMELISAWRAAHGSGPVEHTITVRNLSDAAIALPLQTSLVAPIRAHSGHCLEQWWVEKGGGWPTEFGTHRSQIGPGYRSSLVTVPYSPDDPKRRDPIPWTAVQDAAAQQGIYAGIEFSGRTRMAIRSERPDALTVDLGLDPGDGDYSTRLAPGESFETPTAFVGCYAGSVDDGANRLHRWVERELLPPARDPRYPLLVNNSWGSGMAVDQRLARTMIDDAALLGLEMFHIDAGWFNGVGDWSPNPQKFPQGLGPVADYVHGKGLKFGLWVGWTQGGAARDLGENSTVLSVFDASRKDWFTKDYPADWKTQDFVGADLCLSDTAAQQWCLDTLRRVVREGKLDLLEHDQRMIVEQCDRTDHTHSASPTDIAYRAARGYYRVYDMLRAENPNLLFEDCVNGGRTIDYGILRRVHYISITDSYTALSNRRAFYDASYALPPSVCECYIQNDPVKSTAEFRAMLRSGMMGWCTVMIDMSKWSTEQRSAAARQFALYKSTLRPLIASGNLYHASARPDGKRWDGMQYADAARRRAVLYAFRGSSAEGRHTYPMHGLDPAARYRVACEDRSSPTTIRTGADLLRNGVTVRLADRNTSELVVLDAVP